MSLSWRSLLHLNDENLRTTLSDWPAPPERGGRPKEMGHKNAYAQKQQHKKIHIRCKVQLVAVRARPRHGAHIQDCFYYGQLGFISSPLCNIVLLLRIVRTTCGMLWRIAVVLVVKNQSFKNTSVNFFKISSTSLLQFPLQRLS